MRLTLTQAVCLAAAPGLLRHLLVCAGAAGGSRQVGGQVLHVWRAVHIRIIPPPPQNPPLRYGTSHICIS